MSQDDDNTTRRDMNLDENSEHDEILGEFHDDTVTGPALPRPVKLPVYTISPKFTWVPIIACIAFSGLLAYLMRIVFGLDIIYEPIPEADFGFWGVLGNALIFIAIGAVAAFVLIILIRKKGVSILEKIMKGAFLLLGTFIVWLYGVFILELMGTLIPVDWTATYIWLGLSACISCVLLYFYSSSRFGLRAQNTVVLIYGILIGSYLPSVVGGWTSILILIGFSLYDIYSVRRGPIKEMMERMHHDTLQDAGDEDLEELDMDDITIEIGIGDLAFYSMLTSVTLIAGDVGGPFLVALTGSDLAYFFPFIFTIIGVLVGAFASIEFVKRAKLIPGLPMSIFLGIGMLFLSYLFGWLVFGLA